MVLSCYVHVPFCASICAYCDFCRIQIQPALLEAWKQRIIQEIKIYSMPELDTLYFGGGTPSLLDLKDFNEIVDALPKVNEEFTIECNPESLNRQKLAMYSKCGVNRISLGVQTFNDKLLKICQRKHTAKQAVETILDIKKSSIQNFSIDLIFGLPNQTLEDVNHDLDIFFSLHIPHISIYSLQIEKNSIFGKQKIQPCNSDLEADMFECIQRRMKENGYVHYEISSFCKPGFESKHNMAYWQDDDFYGIGCGASGKINGIRYDNTKNIAKYIQEGPSKIEIQESLQERAMDAIMMALRTKKGLNIADWNNRYKMDFKKKYNSVLNAYKDLWHEKNEYIYLNERGREILNTILVDFMMIE